MLTPATSIARSRSAAGSGTAFAVVTTLFFAWGFVTSNNDPLIAALRAIYRLSFTEALLTQFAFFLAYAVASLPAAAVLARLGPGRTMGAALLLMVAACLLVPVASAIEAYPLVLVALFLLASGITALQVAANPLAAGLGDPARAHFRLTLAQAFNSLGVVLGVHVGSSVMLSGDVFTHGAAEVSGPAARAAALAAVDRAFLLIAGALVLLALLVWLFRRRLDLGGGEQAAASPLAALRSRWALGGALAIFLYVGAEVAIGSVMINFLNQRHVFGASLADAGWYTGWVYWFGALIGRFVGSALLTRLPAARLLAGVAVAAALLALGVAVLPGPVAGWVALSIGLTNAIMFPIIFSLTLERADAPVPATSGLLCLAIVGGAVLPLLVGRVADLGGIAVAFVIPALAYLGVATFAIRAARTPAERT